nr:unnamed protein product [Digitaria exilis]
MRRRRLAAAGGGGPRGAPRSHRLRRAGGGPRRARSITRGKLEEIGADAEANGNDEAAKAPSRVEQQNDGSSLLRESVNVEEPAAVEEGTLLLPRGCQMASMAIGTVASSEEKPLEPAPEKQQPKLHSRKVVKC